MYVFMFVCIYVCMYVYIVSLAKRGKVFVTIFHYHATSKLKKCLYFVSESKNIIFYFKIDIPIKKPKDIIFILFV